MSVRCLVDTNILIDLERAAHRAGSGPPEWLERWGESQVYLAAISWSELFHGVHRARSEQVRARRERFVRACGDWCTILPFDRDVAEVHSRLWSDLESRGARIGAHDLQIAATVLHHQMSLVTRNRREFERVEGLELVEWLGTG